MNGIDMHDRTPPCPSSLRAVLATALFAACAGQQPAAPDSQSTAKPTPTAAAPVAQTAEPERPLPALTKRFPLENKLDVAMLRHVPDLTQSAEIAVLLAGGSETARPGSAALAAHLVLHNADATSGRQSLARQIEQMGGTLTLETGRKSTWVHVRCPAQAWQRAAQAMAAALDAKDAPRSQIERSQQELVGMETAAAELDPVGRTALAILLGDASVASRLQDLQDRDAGEALAFLRRYFRPDRSLLVVRAPGNEAQVEAAIRASFGAWEAGSAAPEGEITTKARPLPSGIAWIRTASTRADGTCDVALVFQLPDSQAKDAIALHVLVNCITVEGIGGRMERLQQEAGLSKLVLRAETIRFGEGSALALRGSMQPNEAVRLYRTALAARQSLRDIPVSTSERTQSRGSAWLSLRASSASASGLLRDDLERTILGIEATAQMNRLAELDQPGALGLDAVREFLALPVAMVVHGGEPPEAGAEVRQCPLKPEALSIPLAQTEDAEQRAAAQTWRTRAIDAVGGAEKLAGIRGYSADRRIETEGAPDLQETVSWNSDGDVVRTRKILNAVVETRLQGSAWTEDASGKRAQLSPQEAEWRRREAARHPLALLIAWSNGALEFRRLTTRTVGDRQLEILEALGDRFERLRIEIDCESSLLRTVECWGTAPEGVATRTVESWTDYRTTDGIRAPFRCTAVIDDGQSTRVSTYSRVAPTRR